MKIATKYQRSPILNKKTLKEERTKLWQKNFGRVSKLGIIRFSLISFTGS